MAAGEVITILEPKIWFSPDVGSQVLPDLIDLPYGEPWPTGWQRIPFTVNGAQWTFVNPKQDIPSDEVGILDTVPSGADTVNVTLQSRTPTMELIQKIAGMFKQTAAARAHVETLTITSTATGGGNIIISLPGGPANVSTVVGASNTPTQTGDAVRANSASFTGWTVGGTGGTVTFTATVAGYRSGDASVSITAATQTAAFSVNPTTQGRSAYERFTLDPSVDNAFLLGMDGHFPANSIRAQAGKARMIAYKVEQTDNPQLHFRTRGNDALLQPVMTARCLNSTVQSAQVAGLTFGTPDLDKNGRIDLFII